MPAKQAFLKICPIPIMLRCTDHLAPPVHSRCFMEVLMSLGSLLYLYPLPLFCFLITFTTSLSISQSRSCVLHEWTQRKTPHTQQQHTTHRTQKYRLIHLLYKGLFPPKSVSNSVLVGYGSSAYIRQIISQRCEFLCFRGYPCNVM